MFVILSEAKDPCIGPALVFFPSRDETIRNTFHTHL
jgi:hypothetical protein